MTTKFSNTYLTSMKVTANPNKKVIHYLRKKRFGSVESRDNRKRGNGDSKRIFKNFSRVLVQRKAEKEGSGSRAIWTLPRGVCRIYLQ